MIRNKKTLAILRTFLNLVKNFIKNFAATRQVPKVILLNFLAKQKEIFNKQFSLCKAKISLDVILKSTNCQTNNKSTGNNGLTVECYKHFSNEVASVLSSAINYKKD